MQKLKQDPVVVTCGPLEDEEVTFNQQPDKTQAQGIASERHVVGRRLASSIKTHVPYKVLGKKSRLVVAGEGRSIGGRLQTLGWSSAPPHLQDPRASHITCVGIVSRGTQSALGKQLVPLQDK